MEYGQTMQWPTEKEQKDKQRSIKRYTEHNYISSNTNPTGGELVVNWLTYVIYINQISSKVAINT
jgi:hypothetical protein